jgi:hypothetical protein
MELMAIRALHRAHAPPDTAAATRDSRPPTSWNSDRLRGRAAWPDGVVFYQNFRRAKHLVTQAVKQFSADDDCVRHCELPLLELNLLHGAGRPTSFTECIQR